MNENNKTVPAGTGQVILVNSSNIDIISQNLTNTDYAIQSFTSSFVKIHTNVITNNDLGIWLYNSTDVVIENNIIMANNYGIDLYHSNNITIFENTISKNNHGISLLESWANNISSNMVLNNNGEGLSIVFSLENIIADNVFSADGLQIYYDPSSNYFAQTVANNTVNGKPLIYWMNENNKTVPGGAGQVVLVNSSNIDIISQNLSDTDVGLQLISSSFVDVINNTLANNDMFGIQLSDSSLNLLSGNTIINSNLDGINVFQSNKNLFSGNTIANNTSGIGLFESLNNYILGNNFLDNNHQALDYNTLYILSSNKFNRNYWNDWTSPDSNNDGIVDSPYPIEGSDNNADPLPQTLPIYNDGTLPDMIVPEDITYEFNTTGNTIEWTIGDSNPGVFIILLDREIFVSYTLWENGTIIIDIDGLEVGTHVFTINLYDLTGNRVTDSVIVMVTLPPPSTIPITSQIPSGSSLSTTDSLSTNNQTPISFLPMVFLIFVVANFRRYRSKR